MVHTLHFMSIEYLSFVISLSMRRKKSTFFLGKSQHSACRGQKNLLFVALGRASFTNFTQTGPGQHYQRKSHRVNGSYIVYVFQGHLVIWDKFFKKFSDKRKKKFEVKGRKSLKIVQNLLI
jgi:hypothetical protein